MAMILGAQALEGILSMRDAIDLLERMSRHEAAGQTLISPRQTTQFKDGWMRLMFAADYAAGYGVTKAFHLVRGAGVRYVVSLYRLQDGELLAVLDGRLITDLRTGAASGVVARHMTLPAVVKVGIIGSGHQARMQLDCLATELKVASATVFSPTPANREKFAADMSAKLGVAVSAVDCAEPAVRGHDVVVVATSAVGAEPLVHAAWLKNCKLVCAVGSTRPESVEVDAAAFGNAELVIVDSLLAAEEAGDLQRAISSGKLARDRQITLAQMVAQGKRAMSGGYAIFKSVGSGLQDLALAARCYELLKPRPELHDARDLGSLKVPLSAAQHTTEITNG